MPAIRSLQSIAKKWQDRAGSAGQQYADGVNTPKKDWASQATAAQGSWEAGITQAANTKAFSKGVAKATTAKWQKKAVSKGVPRYPQGVQEATPDFTLGFEPYRNVIENTQLPPRMAKGDPRNINRVAAISQALRKAKTG